MLETQSPEAIKQLSFTKKYIYISFKLELEKLPNLHRISLVKILISGWLFKSNRTFNFTRFVYGFG